MSKFTTKYLNDVLLPSQFLQDAIANQKFSEGKSGSFFVFSPDKRLIIKTVPKHEFESMQRLLPAYYRHLEKYPNSLLVRILGTYSMQLVHTEVYVIFMANLFTMPIDEKYDLKGSWVARTAEENSSVKKDNDFQKTITVGPDAADRILAQINVDTQLLAKHNIMDYSLLLGIQDPLRRRDSLKNSTAISMDTLPTNIIVQLDAINERSIVPSVQGQRYYVLGIIDTLQDYNFSKKVERFLKVSIKRNDAKGVSVIDPTSYQQRFIEKMGQIIV